MQIKISNSCYNDNNNNEYLWMFYLFVFLFLFQVKHDLSETPQEPKKIRLDIFSTLEKEEKLSKEKERESEKEKEKEKLKKEREQKEKDEKERREKIAAEKAAATTEKGFATAATEKSAAKERESQDSSDDNMDTDGFAVDLGIACNVCQYVLVNFHKNWLYLVDWLVSLFNAKDILVE